jgi:hypothetical protein
MCTRQQAGGTPARAITGRIAAHSWSFFQAEEAKSFDFSADFRGCSFHTRGNFFFFFNDLLRLKE